MPYGINANSTLNSVDREGLQRFYAPDQLCGFLEIRF